MIRGKEVIEHEWGSGYVFRQVKYPKIISIRGAWVIDQFGEPGEPGEQIDLAPSEKSGVGFERL